jgi:hypothetical protein
MQKQGAKNPIHREAAATKKEFNTEKRWRRNSIEVGRRGNKQ